MCMYLYSYNVLTYAHSQHAGTGCHARTAVYEGGLDQQPVCLEATLDGRLCLCLALEVACREVGRKGGRKGEREKERGRESERRREEGRQKERGRRETRRGVFKNEHTRAARFSSSFTTPFAAPNRLKCTQLHRKDHRMSTSPTRATSIPIRTRQYVASERLRYDAAHTDIDELLSSSILG